MQPSYRPAQQMQPSYRPAQQMQPSYRPAQQMQPSYRPAQQMQPSYRPAQQMQPSHRPAQQPHMQPSYRPAQQPHMQPSYWPAQQPHMQPSYWPAQQPKMQPSYRPGMGVAYGNYGSSYGSNKPGFPGDSGSAAIYGGQNNTNSSECPPHSDAWDWLYTMCPAYIVVISVLGILGNVFVLLVFCLHKKACTVAEIYLGNLAAADLLLVSCLPFWAANIANEFQWHFGGFLCRLVNLGIKMNTYCSIYFLVLVSGDRYVALVHTMSHGRMRRPKYAKLSCLLVWGFGLLMGSPTLIFRVVMYIPEYNVTACFLDYPNKTTELLCDGMLIIFSFIIPVSIISFCTLKIIQALKNQAMERFNAENTERKATLLVLAVLLAFLICWVPFHLATILDVLLRAGILKGCHLATVLDICNQIFTYMAFFNSVLNPILYVIVGKNFRKKVRELFEQLAIKRMVVESTRSQLSSTLKTLV
ncbi:B2 bradykinin receptor-like [Diretmus argenteus]